MNQGCIFPPEHPKIGELGANFIIQFKTGTGLAGVSKFMSLPCTCVKIFATSEECWDNPMLKDFKTLQGYSPQKPLSSKVIYGLFLESHLLTNP